LEENNAMIQASVRICSLYCEVCICLYESW